MLYRASVDHSGVFEPDLVVAAVMAVYGLWTRPQVTPLARPRDKAGRPLVIRGTSSSSVGPWRPGSRPVLLGGRGGFRRIREQPGLVRRIPSPFQQDRKECVEGFLSGLAA